MNLDRRALLCGLAAACAPQFALRLPLADRTNDDRPSRADLAAAAEALIRDAGAADVAVASHDLATGEELLIHADVNFHPASTIKIAIMMEVFRQAEARSFSLDDRMSVKNDFASIVDGSHFSLQAADDSETGLYRRIGERLSMRELVGLMITESSNIATNMLVERISPEKATEFMRTLGTNDVRVLRGVEDSKAYARGLSNASTARGLMQILVRLAERSVVSAKASDEMVAIMRRQKFNEGIPAGLPPGTTVAHKTGSFSKVYHDAGIIEPAGRKPLVLVIFTRGIEKEPRAHRLVADITRRIFEHAAAGR